MEYVGIVLAKSESERLRNKNFLNIGTKKVYQYAVEAIRAHISDVYVSTDAETPYKNIYRTEAAKISDEPIFDALKWTYKSLPKRYDAIICVFANCPMVSSEDVGNAIEYFNSGKYNELRSFNTEGDESGLMIFKESYLLEKKEISTHQGMIFVESLEIHTQKDFDKCKSILLQN